MNTPQTVFQIASVSKQFAAGAILLLQEQGLLSVHDSIRSWLPDCPLEWGAITLHHLLSHTSGIGHWRDFHDLSLYAPIPWEHLIDIFQRKPLMFLPGARWSYSSPGYVLVAYVVEKVSGEAYASFLKERIFHPLGMHSTGAGNAPPGLMRQAAGYSGAERAPTFELDHVSIGAGDIWSTSGDLARWNAALATAGFLGETSLEAMFTSHVSVPWDGGGMTNMGYGYGWFMARLHGRPVRFHPGDNPGFQAFNAWFPDDDSVIILLANDDQTNLNTMIVHIATGLLAGDTHTP